MIQRAYPLRSISLQHILSIVESDDMGVEGEFYGRGYLDYRLSIIFWHFEAVPRFSF